MSHRKTDLEIPCSSKSAKVVPVLLHALLSCQDSGGKGIRLGAAVRLRLEIVGGQKIDLKLLVPFKWLLDRERKGEGQVFEFFR